MTDTQTPSESLSMATSRQLSELIQDFCNELVRHTTSPVWWSQDCPPDARTGALRREQSVRLRHMRLYGIQEATPGAKWQSLFAATWSAYRSWYLSEGPDLRPDLASCREALNPSTANIDD